MQKNKIMKTKNNLRYNKFLDYLDRFFKESLSKFLKSKLVSVKNLIKGYNQKFYWYIHQFKPKSVLSLVMVGFTAVVTPLALSVFFASVVLTNLVEKKASLVRTVVDTTRKSQNINNGLVDMERVARQYHLIKSIYLFNLYKKYHNSFLENVNYLQKYLNKDFSLTAVNLTSLANKILDMMNTKVLKDEELKNILGLFAEMSSLTKIILDQNKIWVDIQVKHTRLIAKNIRRTFILQGIFLLPLTLFLIFIFISLIAHPIKQIEQAIHSLGDQHFSGKIEVQGPKDLRHLGNRLEWLRIRFQELEEEKLKFIRHMSHELKTPLTSFKEGVSLLAEEIPGVLTESQREVVDILSYNSNELQRRIENLLDLNLILMNSQLDLEEFDISELVKDRIPQFKLLLKNKNLELKLHGPLARITADKTKVTAILDNLLSNAVCFSPQNGIIYISWSLLTTYLELKIEDEGPGIKSDEKEKIFEPFFQGASSRKGPLKGSGIGLSVVQEFIRVHKGTIELLESLRGACFQIKLPYIQN